MDDRPPRIPGDCLACKLIAERVVANLTNPITMKAVSKDVETDIYGVCFHSVRQK
jgi:hypothetical protein